MLSYEYCVSTRLRNEAIMADGQRLSNISTPGNSSTVVAPAVILSTSFVALIVSFV